MDKFRLFNEEAVLLKSSNDNKEIAKELNSAGVRFEQWDTKDSDEILEAYKPEIDKLIAENGYQSFDVISLDASHPDKDAFRQKFITEHTHSEDEVRFFVKGAGLFTMHIKDQVYAVLCQAGDLISVPAGTPHWFDMGDQPNFTCIRLFNNPDGWVAKYTESGIDKNFPRID